MSLATIIAKARLIPRDFGEPFEARVTGDGTTMRFDLPVGNIDTLGLAVYIDGSPPVMLTPELDPAAINTGEYYLEPRAGQITLGVPLASNAVLVVQGMGGLASITEDIEDFVAIAFEIHTQGTAPAATMDTLDPLNEYLVAILAVIELLWSQIAEAAQEVDVSTPEGMHIPAGQRFQQLMALMDRLQAQYTQMSMALNVGLYRIEMFNLRRVSLTNGRLVPMYVEREFDDISPPVRVYPSIDPGGATAQPIAGLDGGGVTTQPSSPGIDGGAP